MAGQSGEARIAEIRRWHVDVNKWADIGYHYLIDRDGARYTGRPIDLNGAFEPKVNATAIGICLIGGFGANTNDEFSKNYTLEQDAALRTLIDELRAKYPIKKVSGHNEYANKACPGFNVSRWLNNKPAARTFVESKTAAGAGSATVAATGLAAVEIIPALTETKAALQEANGVDPGTDPIRWVLLAVILIGAGYALYRRWVDWNAGRQ